MKLRVKPSSNISEMNAAFRQDFPYLKLAFFSKPHQAYKGSHAKYLFTDPTMTVRDIAAHPHESELYIEAEMPTWQVERLFEQEFGMHVQVFRKSGNLWLETSVTDDLTLEQQNAKGKASEKSEVPVAEPVDYREHE